MTGRIFYVSAIACAIAAALTIVTLIPQTAFGAIGVPRILNNQGRLMDPSGTLLGGSGTDFCFKFSLYDNATVGSGSKLWPSSAPSTMTVVVRNGIYNVGIGDTNAGGDTLDFNFSDNDTVFLNVEVATKVGATCAPGDGAESFETLSPRQRIVAAGYAINAASVGGYIAAQDATGSQIPVLSAGRLVLGGAAASLNATSTNALTLQGGGQATGDIQFFSSANKITSAGNVTFAGQIVAASASVTAATSSSFAVTGLASTSNLVVSNGFTFGAATGILKSVAGIVSSTLVDLATDITGILGVGNGGTGWSNIASGAVVLGNGTGSLSTTTAGANGQVLALVDGTPAWVATSTLSTITGTLAVNKGGTGQSSTPTFGQLLVGNASGGFALSATSSLSISSSDVIEGSKLFYTDSRVQTYLNGVEKGFFFSTTSTDYYVSQANLSAFSTTSADYWKSVRDFFSTSSAAYFASAGLAFSTTSTDYWETTQTARTADDLTNNSIEELNDVAAMTENYGDLFAWNGSTWTDFATSSLAIALSDTTGTLGATRGGTGLSSVSAAGILIGNYSGTGWQQLSTSTLGLLTTDIIEGNKLFYTDARVQTYLDAIAKGYFFSTTSAQYFASTGQAFSTTSTDFWKMTRDFFSTSSALYFSSTGQAFSTTSADFHLTQNQGASFSSTSANYFVSSSTTIPKTYTANTFTNTQSFGTIFMNNATSSQLFSSTLFSLNGVFGLLTSTTSSHFASTTAFGRFITGNIIATSTATSTFGGPLSVGISDSSYTASIFGSTTAPTSATGTAILAVTNNNATLSSGTNVLRLNSRIPYATSCTSGTTCPRFIEYFTGLPAGTDTGGRGVGSLRLSTAGTGITQTSGAADFAEFMILNSAASVGDLVSLNSSGEYQRAVAGQSLIGVISNNPAFVGNANLEGEPNAYIVGFAGVIETAVSDGNGPISAGDFITASTSAGIGVKLTESGYALGQALESFSGPGNGTISVLVMPKFVDASIALESYGGFGGGVTGYWDLSTSTGQVTLASSTYTLMVNNASTTNISASYASSTRAFFGSLSVANLSGVLRAAAGSVTTGLINLATDITGILGVSNGGTGWSNIAAGAVVLGNGTDSLSTTTAGTNGQVLALVDGTPAWVATSTLSTITGTLAVNKGGTGLSSTPTYGQLLVGNSSGSYALTATSTLGISSSDVIEGSKLFYTDARVQTYLNGVEKGFFFSTTSVDYWKTASDFFSTTSAAYFVSTGQAFSTTSAGYFLSLNQGASFSSTSAQYFVHSSSTIPKTYSENTFTGNNAFIGNVTIGTLDGPLQSNNGVVSATTSVGVMYGGTGLSVAPGYGELLLGSAAGGYTLAATSSLGLDFSNLIGSASDGQVADGLTIDGGSINNTPIGTTIASTAIFTNSTSTNATTTTMFATFLATTNATTTNLFATIASTTNLYGAGLSSCNGGNVLTWNGGLFGCAIDQVGSAGGFSFTPGTFGAIPVNATTTALQLQGGLYASSTVRFGNAGVSPLFFDGAVGNLGLGSTSPLAKLSIHALNGETNKTLFAIGSSTASETSTLFSVDNTGITTIGNENGTGDSTFQFASDDDAFSMGYSASDKSFRIASSTNLSTNVLFSLAKGGAATFFGGVSVPTLSNCTQALETDEDGNIVCGTDVSGGAGGSGVWATTTDSLAAHPADPSDVILIGQTSTSTTGNIFEVGGNALLRGLATAYGVITAPRFSATSTSATSTFAGGLDVAAINQTGSATSTFANGIQLSGGCFKDASGNCVGGSAVSTLDDLTDVVISGAVYGDLLMHNGTDWVDAATSSLGIALSDTTGTLAVGRGGTGISSVAAAGVLLGNYAGTGYQQIATSSLGLLSTHVAEGSNLYFTNVRVQTYLDVLEKGYFFSTTSAQYFIHSSTTVPKTYANNTFTGSNTFSGQTNLGNASTTNATVSGLASTSDLVVSDSFTLANLTGFLKATAGAIASALVDLTADVTGILGIANGGTGTSTAPSQGQLLVGNAASAYDYLATSSLMIALDDTTGILAETRGGTGQTAYNAGDLLYASGSNTLTRLAIGGSGSVLKISGSSLVWGTDLTTGGGGGAGAWATTTDSLAVYPTDTTDVVIVGSNATSTLGSIFEVVGTAYISNSLGIGTTSPGTMLSIRGVGNFDEGGSTLYGPLSLGALVATSSLTVSGHTTLGNASTTNLSASYASSTQGFFGSLSLGNLSGVLKATAGSISASLVNLASEVTGILGISNGGTGTSTAPSYGQVLIGNAVGGYDLVATSSLGISGGSESSFSTTSAQYFVHSSSTIPKTYAQNTFSALQTFGNASTTNVSATYSSSTNLTAGNFTLGNLTGFLKATAGSVATSLVDAASDVTGILGLGNGGTGWSNIFSGTLLTGNGAGALATTTVGTGLQLSGGSLTNAGITSVQHSSGSAQSGAITIATSSATANGQTVRLIVTNAGGTFTFAPSISGTLDNTGLTNSSLTVTAGGGLSGGGAVSLGGSTSLSLDLTNANVWTGLQRFQGSASTTALSALDYVAVGRTSTTTIQGAVAGTSTIQGFLDVAGAGSTSTFSGGLAANRFNATGVNATSSFASGINISGGCFAMNGTCLKSGTDGVEIYASTSIGTTGTWTAPAGVEFAQVIVTGAGGGGGGVDSDGATVEAPGGGGGAGGTSIETFSASEIGSSQTVAVGAGGAGGPATGGPGGTGGYSYFGSPTLVGSNGGNGGTGTISSDSTAAPRGIPGGAGATASSTGDINLGGSPGEDGDAPLNNQVYAGSGGDSYWGGGGEGARATSTTVTAAGGDGKAAGSGGGGGAVADTATGATGGNGANGGVFVFSYTASGADLAEWYPSEADVEPGDIVSISGDSLEYESFGLGLKRTAIMEKAIHGSKVVGVVTTLPNIAMGGEVLGAAEHASPIALAGRVPVKVSDENGMVKAGDQLTVSSNPGIAMRATKAGVTIGKALEDATCLETFAEEIHGVAGEVCTVMTLVSTTFTTGILLKQAMSEDGLLLEEVPANVDPSRIVLAKLIQDKKDITASSTLSEISTDRLVAGLEIITPRLVADTLVVNTIEPVEKDVRIGLTDDGKFVIERVLQEDMTVTFGNASTTSATSSLALSVDALGNAMFAGALRAANIEIGTAEKPGGITMYDALGKAYCSRIIGGELATLPGKCGEEAEEEPVPLASAPVPLPEPEQGEVEGESAETDTASSSPQESASESEPEVAGNATTTDSAPETSAQESTEPKVLPTEPEATESAQSATELPPAPPAETASEPPTEAPPAQELPAETPPAPETAAAPPADVPATP